MQFHFACIYSPWIRRALVAGGFGTSAPHAHLPHEIAPVTPYNEADIADRDTHLDHYKAQPTDLESAGGENLDTRCVSQGSNYSNEIKPATGTRTNSVQGAQNLDVRSIESGSSTSLQHLSSEGVQNGYGTMPTAPLVPTATPRFHFDLHAAVKAAENGARHEGPTLGDTH